GHELIQCALVEGAALRLVQRWLVWQQAAGDQLLQYGLVDTRNAARRVHVLDAHQPAPTVCTRIQPAGQRGDQRAGMERAGGRGGKSTSIARQRTSHKQEETVLELTPAAAAPGRPKQGQPPRGAA